MPVLMCCRIFSPWLPGLSRSHTTSLYSSRYVAVTTHVHPATRSTREKRSTPRRGMMPRSVALPMIVWLLPEPVWPYAKIVPL